MENSYQCPVCKLIFSNQLEFSTHYNHFHVNVGQNLSSTNPCNSSGKKHKCGLCDFQSDKKWIVIRHQKKKHMKNDNKLENKKSIQKPRENVKYLEEDLESMESNDSTESDTESEDDEFIDKFEKCCNQINNLTSSLIGVRMRYIKLLDEIKEMKMNKENKTIMIECMEKYFIYLHNMKDLYYFHNSQDDNDETLADDKESGGSDNGTDGSDNIDSGSVSGDDNNSANEYDESEYGAGETDDASEALSKKSDDNELEGGYTAFHKGFHKFYIKFEDEIKAKGGWVMSKFLTMKEEEGMDMECEDESHKLANDQFVKRFLKRDEKIQRGRGIGGILG